MTKKYMRKYSDTIASVREMMMKFGQDAPDTPIPMSEEVAIARHNWLLEEYMELLEAEKKSNVVEFADALADIVVIAAGTIVASGGQHLLPKSRKKESVYSGFDRPDFISANRRGRYSGTLVVRQEMKNGMSYYGRQKMLSPQQALDFGLVIIDLCMMMAFEQGIDLPLAIEEVQRSNMSKVNPLTGEVERREDGKICKPSTYSPPSLEGFCFGDSLLLIDG